MFYNIVKQFYSNKKVRKKKQKSHPDHLFLKPEKVSCSENLSVILDNKVRVKLWIRVCHSGHLPDSTATRGEVLNSPAHWVSGQGPLSRLLLLQPWWTPQAWRKENSVGTTLVLVGNTVGPRITWAASAPNTHLPGF